MKSHCRYQSYSEWNVRLTQYFSIPAEAAAVPQYSSDLLAVQEWISLNRVGVAFRDHAGIFDDRLVLRQRWSTLR